MPFDDDHEQVSGPAAVFLYSAKTQFSNAGDALINRELLKLLRCRGQIMAMGGGAPAGFLKEVGLKAEEVVFQDAMTLLAAAFKLRFSGRQVYLVQTPGDMGASPMNLAALLRAAAAPLLAMAGIRVIQAGASLGPMSSPQLRLFAWRTRFMHGLGLRDPISLEVAQRAGFRHTTYFPDLAFAYDGVAVEGPAVMRPSGRIALSFRDDFASEEAKQAVIRKIAAGLQGLPATPDLTIVVQVSRDRTLAEELKTAFAEWAPDILELSSLSALRDFYRGIDLTISNRLHVLLWSGLAGAVPIAFVNREVNRKIVGLYDGVGLSEFIALDDREIDIGKFQADLDRYKSVFSAVYRAERGRVDATMDQIVSGVGSRNA